MLLDIHQQRFWVNEASPRGYILERVLRGTGGGAFVRQNVEGRPTSSATWSRSSGGTDGGTNVNTACPPFASCIGDQL